MIDATCGNGYDTLFLAELALTPTSGTLHAFDIQPEAIASTHHRLSTLPHPLLNRTHLHLTSHATLPSCTPSLIVYNLGYLPGASKSLTTRTSSTLTSLTSALSILAPGGLISLTTYPGHPEGLAEHQALLTFFDDLNRSCYDTCIHTWDSHPTHPNLLIIKNLNN